jgi:alkyl hydroperoxide reductase subunit AhpC
MAVLYLDLEADNSGGRELHDWLGGAWAVLFSNPEDFRLDRMCEGFELRGLRALAVRRDGGPAPLDSHYVTLPEPSFAAADAVSFAARALRGELLTLKSRFALLIDGSLRHREVLNYSVGRSAETAPRMLAPVDALRSYHSIGRAA